jgi:hypothetical protein
MMYHWQCGYCMAGLLPILLAMSCSIRQPLLRLMDRMDRPIVWRLQSPDLTPTNFYLWGHPKHIFYAQRCNTSDGLWNATEAAGTTVCNVPDFFWWTKNSWCNRAQLTIMVDCFNIFYKPLVTGQMPFSSQLINSLFTSTLFVYFSFLMLPVAIHISHMKRL